MISLRPSDPRLKNVPGGISASRSRNVCPLSGSMSIFPTSSSRQKTKFCRFPNYVERTFTQEASTGGREWPTVQSPLSLRCGSKAFNPRGSTVWPRLGSAVRFSGTLVPASYSPAQPLSLLSSWSCLTSPTPRSNIFFSAVASLVLRADINCSRAPRTSIFSCWHVSLHLLSWGWRRGFQ